MTTAEFFPLYGYVNRATGHRIIAVLPALWDRQDIYVIGDRGPGTASRFVTWAVSKPRNVASGKYPEHAFYSGHYHTDYRNALIDLGKRAGFRGGDIR